MISALMLIGLILAIIIAFAGGLITGAFLLDKDYPVVQTDESEGIYDHGLSKKENEIYLNEIERRK